MIADILMAFVVALFLEMFALINKRFKQMIILVSCIGLIVVYFINSYQSNFIGTMDFSIWILFVIVFDAVLAYVAKKLNGIKK